MAFNHYAKIKRILSDYEGWTIRLIPESTEAQNFRGEVIKFPHYYRIYDRNGKPIKYCKFQQIERLAKVLGVPAEALPVVDDSRSSN